MKHHAYKLLIIAIAAIFIAALPASAETRLLGDVDGDGSLGASDAALILRSLVGLEELFGGDYMAADVNQDGSVGADDAAYVLRSLVELTPKPESVSLDKYAESVTVETPEVMFVGETQSLTASHAPSDAKVRFVLEHSVSEVCRADYSERKLTLWAMAAGDCELTLRDSLSRRYAKVSVSVLPIPDESDELYVDICTGLFALAPSQLDAKQKDEALALYTHVLALDDQQPYTAVIRAGLKYCGTPYDELDCSNFTKQAYRDCGYGSKYIVAGTNAQIELFRERGVLFELEFTGGEADLSRVPIGAVLLWTDSDDYGNHSALYLGEVNGTHYLLESVGSSNGVAINENWGSYSKWNLKYYALVLGA